MSGYSPRYNKVHFHACLQFQIPKGTFSCLGTVPGTTKYIPFPGTVPGTTRYIIMLGYSPRYNNVHYLVRVQSQVPQGTFSCLGTFPGTTRYIIMQGNSPRYHKKHSLAWVQSYVPQGTLSCLVKVPIITRCIPCPGTIQGTARYILMPWYSPRYQKLLSHAWLPLQVPQGTFHVRVQSQVPQGTLSCLGTVPGTTR